MVFFALFTAFLLHKTTFALEAKETADFSIERVSDRIQLRGDPARCEEYSSILQDLAAWKLASGGVACDAAAAKMRVLNQPCAFDITDCLPDHPRKYLGIELFQGDANCHNTALIYAKILPALRYSAPEEIEFYLPSPLCKELGGDEKPRPGDLGLFGVWVSPDRWQASHSFAYISERISFSKEGPGRVPFELMSFTHEMNRWASGPCPWKGGARRPPAGSPTPKESSCNTLSYFRCQSMQEYLNSHGPLTTEISAPMREIEAMESCVEETERSSGISTGAILETLTEATKALIRYAQDERAREKKVDVPPGQRERNQFLLGALQLRVDSLAQHLGLMRGSQRVRSEGLRALAATLKDSIQQLKR